MKRIPFLLILWLFPFWGYADAIVQDFAGLATKSELGRLKTALDEVSRDVKVQFAFFSHYSLSCDSLIAKNTSIIKEHPTVFIYIKPSECQADKSQPAKVFIKWLPSENTALVPECFQDKTEMDLLMDSLHFVVKEKVNSIRHLKHLESMEFIARKLRDQYMSCTTGVPVVVSEGEDLLVSNDNAISEDSPENWYGWYVTLSTGKAVLMGGNKGLYRVFLKDDISGTGTKFIGESKAGVFVLDAKATHNDLRKLIKSQMRFLGISPKDFKKIDIISTSKGKAGLAIDAGYQGIHFPTQMNRGKFIYPIGIILLPKGDWIFEIQNFPKILGNINDLRAGLEHEKRHVWQLSQILTTPSQVSPFKGEVYSCKQARQYSGTFMGWYRWRLEIDAIRTQKQNNSKIYQSSSVYYKNTFVTKYLSYCEKAYDGYKALLPDFRILSTISGFKPR